MFEDLESFIEAFERAHDRPIIVCENFDSRLAVTRALVSLGYDDGGRINRVNDFEYPNVKYGTFGDICYTRLKPADVNMYITDDEFLALVDAAEGTIQAPSLDTLYSFVTRG